MNTIQRELLAALKAVLNDELKPKLSEEVIEEAKQQAVYSLICSNPDAYLYIAANVQILWEQQELEKVLSGIRYLVIKGSAASIYYPEPLRRTLGDIDILVRKEDYEETKRLLIDAGYTEGNEDKRHIHYYKDKVTIELHRRFAVLQTALQEEMLDEWLFESSVVVGELGKYTFPMVPDHLNGLILLAHINQHLEEGIGLRQLVDWVMFVRHSLSDSEWPSFREKTELLGLTDIAKVTAKFGQMYLGLNEEIHWCSDASEDTVEALLEYVHNCGNFGHKDANNTVVMILSHGRGLRGFFRNLQRQGEWNWNALERRPYLRPLAWAYQLGRYAQRGIKSGAVKNLKHNIVSSVKRNRLMDDLGATRLALRNDAPRKIQNKRLRELYYRLKKTPFRVPLYYLNDLYFIFRHLLMGAPKISETDINNVENNVTFIYKSFNRQRQAIRCYHCIKSYYPKVRVIIADDSNQPLEIDGAEIIYLPYNSGLSKGLKAALECVKTPYVMRLDDDELLTPNSNVHEQLAFLQLHPEVDLIGIQGDHRNPERMAEEYSRIKMKKELLIPAGTIIDEKEVVYKSYNTYLARTDSLKKVGYDPNIRMIDHHEFFYRAAGQIVAVQDYHSYVFHCHNRFENEYDRFRGDTAGDAHYIFQKHGRDY